jgi:hypothetical protein
MARKRAAPEDLPFEKAKAAYSEIGKILYGSGEESETRKERRSDRRKLKFTRRMIEYYYPELRFGERDTYREGALDRDLPVPRMAIEYSLAGQAGRIVFPNGSRRMYKAIPFSSREDLLNHLAKMINDGMVDPDRTQVVEGGSAQLLRTVLGYEAIVQP